MVTITQLFPAFAAALGLNDESIRQRARFLREAGYLPATVGKRLAYANSAARRQPTGRHPRRRPRRLHRQGRGIAQASERCTTSATAKRSRRPIPARSSDWRPITGFVDALEALIALATQGDITGPSGLPIEPISASIERPSAHGRISFRDAPRTLQIFYEPPVADDVTDHVAIARGDGRAVRRRGPAHEAAHWLHRRIAEFGCGAGRSDGVSEWRRAAIATAQIGVLPGLVARMCTPYQLGRGFCAPRSDGNEAS